MCDGLFVQIDTRYSNLWNVPSAVRMEVEVEPGMVPFFCSQLHPHLVPGMEKMPVSVGSLNVCLLVWGQYLSLQAGLVPACLWLVTSSPGWGLPTVPWRWIKGLREARGNPHAGWAGGRSARPCQALAGQEVPHRQPVSMASHAAHSSRLIDTHSGPACGSCRIKADVCSWFELDPINRPLFVSK